MNELIIHLDGKGDKPLYEQIYEYIRGEIEHARIEPGEKLPSSRALSAYLQVSRSTVDMAYGQLVAEGYVDAVACKGYYVCSLPLPRNLRTGLEHTDWEAAGAGQVKAGALEGTEKFRYDFTPNGIDLNRFPIFAWRKITKNTLSQEKEELLRLGDARGERYLRETLCEYLGRARGIRCVPENILLGAGNDYLLILLCQLMGIGRRIGMEIYTYRQAYLTFQSLGLDVCAVPMDGDGMRVEELEKSGADMAYVMPSHQFPTGIVMPVKRRMELLDWAYAREGRYIIEDDYDSEFRYGGRPIPALQGYDRHGKVIYMGTLSKSVAPAIRISYMVLPEELMEIYRRKAGYLTSTVSRIDQMIVHEFFRDGYYERHLSRMRAAYKKKRDVLMAALAGCFQEKCAVFGEEAGVHLLAGFSLGRTEEELVGRAKEAGIRLYGLSGYRIAPGGGTGFVPWLQEGRNGESGRPQEAAIFLMGYAHMEEEEIRAAVQELRELFR